MFERKHFLTINALRCNLHEGCLLMHWSKYLVKKNLNILTFKSSRAIFGGEKSQNPHNEFVNNAEVETVFYILITLFFITLQKVFIY